MKFDIDAGAYDGWDFMSTGDKTLVRYEDTGSAHNGPTFTPTQCDSF